MGVGNVPLRRIEIPEQVVQVGFSLLFFFWKASIN